MHAAEVEAGESAFRMNHDGRSLRRIATLVATLALSSCSSGSSTPAAASPLSSSPTPTTPASRLQFRIIDSGDGNRGPIGQRPYTQYYGCGEIFNGGPFEATLMLKLTPIGPNGEPYVVTPIGGSQTKNIDVLGDIIGCGLPSVLDYDSTHKDATRYRVRIDASYGDGLSESIEREAAIVYRSTPPPVVVISRFRVAGTRGGRSDQFIEIQNVSSETVAMTSVYLDIWIPDNADPYRIFTTFRPFRGSIGPGCHWLIGVIGVNGTLSVIDGVNADGALSAPLEADGGLALRYTDGRVIDQVGMNDASVFKEGQPLAPIAVNNSYTRVADSGNNAADFRLSGEGPPNNSSTCTPPFQ